MRLRAARSEDYDAYATLFREIDPGDTVPSRADFDEDRVGKTVVAEDASGVVGYCVLVLLSDAVGHVSELAVAPSARRRGVGHLLLADAARRASPRRTLSLNVREDNAPAVRLYERFGFAPAYRQRALAADWDVVLGWPRELAPHADAVRALEPADDAGAEAAFELAPGTLADARHLPGRCLRVLERGGEVTACAVFDTTFPGALPFRAKTPADAFSLLRALRADARPGDTSIKIVVREELGAPLLASGVALRYGLVHMRAPLNPQAAAPGTS